MRRIILRKFQFDEICCFHLGFPSVKGKDIGSIFKTNLRNLA